MNEQDLLADCLRRLNRSGVTYYLTGSMASIRELRPYMYWLGYLRNRRQAGELD